MKVNESSDRKRLFKSDIRNNTMDAIRVMASVRWKHHNPTSSFQIFPGYSCQSCKSSVELKHEENLQQNPQFNLVDIFQQSTEFSLHTTEEEHRGPIMEKEIIDDEKKKRVPLKTELLKVVL